MTLNSSDGFVGTDRFEVVRELGAGAMGVVYEVIDREHNSTIALKTLKAADARKLFRFKQEFRALAELDHPNLIHLHELFADGDLWYFTMDYVPGVTFTEYIFRSDETHDQATDDAHEYPTLTDQVDGEVDDSSNAAPDTTTPTNRLQHGRRFVDLDRLRESLRQLALGLVDLHSKGMLHRDIKPANVMVTTTGRTVLLDFGLVAAMEADVYESVEKGLAGTAGYMAPEQAQGKPLTNASDWYAVGVMLYQALTDRLPFRGKLIDMLRKKVREQATPPIELHPGVPKDLNDLCVGLLERKPNERTSGAEVLEVLKKVGDNVVPIAPTEPQIEIPFVGREKQMETLFSSLQFAKSSTTMVAEVHGESGMGKSMLIDEFVGRIASDEDVLVIQGRCYEQESVPFKAIDSVIDELTRYLLSLDDEERDDLLPDNIARLARLFPVLKRVKSIAAEVEELSDVADPRQLRLSAFAALAKLINAISEQRTLVITIDDMQWGDVDSAILLNQVLQFGFELRLMIVIGYRVEYVNTSPCLMTLHKGKWRTGKTSHSSLSSSHSSLSSSHSSLSFSEGWSSGASVLFREGDTSFLLEPADVQRVEIPILPMSSNSIYQLVQGLLPDAAAVPKSVIEQIITESAGSPYFALELVKFIGSGNSFATAEEQLLQLDEVLWNRVLQLSPDAQRFLQIVATAAKPMEMRHVFQASALEQLNPHDLRQLHAGRFIRSEGQGLDSEVATFHDRVRESVVNHLDSETLKAHHLALADTLADSPGADLELIASSYFEAGDRKKAFTYSIQAADATATALAFSRASELYRRSLDLMDNETEGKIEFELRRKLADTLADSGLGSEAADEYQHAALLATGNERVELESLAAFNHCTGGRIEIGRELLVQALKKVGIKMPPSSALGSVMAILRERFFLLCGRFRFKRRDVSQIDPRLLLKIDTASRAAKALSLFDVAAGVYLQARVLRLALKAGELERIVGSMAWTAATYATSLYNFDIEIAENLIHRAKEHAKKVDTAYVRGIVALGEACTALTTGQFVRARDAAVTADTQFRTGCTGVTWERDSSQMFHTWALMFMGEFTELTAYAEAAVFDACEREDVYAATSHAVFALASARLAMGDPDGAEFGMEENMANWTKQGYHLQHWFQMLSNSMIGIYRGRPESGWVRFDDEFKQAKRAMLFEVRIFQIEYYAFKGRAAVACLFLNPTQKQYRVSAEMCAKKLAKTKIEWATAQGHGIRAGLAILAGDRDESISQLKLALDGYEKTSMGAHAAATKIRLGQMLEGTKAREFTRSGLAFMRAQQVGDIPRLVNVFSPGFVDV